MERGLLKMLFWFIMHFYITLCFTKSKYASQYYYYFFYYIIIITHKDSKTEFYVFSLYRFRLAIWFSIYFPGRFFFLSNSKNAILKSFRFWISRTILFLLVFKHTLWLVVLIYYLTFIKSYSVCEISFPEPLLCLNRSCDSSRCYARSTSASPAAVRIWRAVQSSASVFTRIPNGSPTVRKSNLRPYPLEDCLWKRLCWSWTAIR